jgi:nucleoside-diphosphate-sugar epimerase
MYAFGRGEQPRRLISRAVAAAQANVPLTVPGGGRSYLNPLPVDFVADALLAVADRADDPPFAAYNLNHPRPTTVLDVLDIVRSEIDLELDVVDGGESQPVHFYGVLDSMALVLSTAGISIPDPETSVADHVRDLKDHPHQ